jgi:hypothetical protein
MDKRRTLVFIPGKKKKQEKNKKLTHRKRTRQAPFAGG